MVIGTKEREIVVEYIEPEGGADTGLTNQEGKVEQFPIQEDALPTIDKKSNVTPFRIPAPDEAQQTVQEYRLEAENNRIPPPEAKPLPAKTREQANQEAFFALSQLGGGDNIESDKNQSVTQLINDGKSDIVTKAESQAAVINEEERITVMESFMADPTVNSDAKKKVLTRHSRGGYLPSSLKENYINKLSKPNPNLPSSLRESQNIVQTQMPQRVLTHYDRILDEDVSKRGVRGHISAFFEGIDHVWDGSELQILGGSKAEYDAGMIEFRKTQEEYRVASALGHMTGIIAPASLALFTGGFIVPIATAAFIAAVIDGTSRFSELDYEGVDYDTALKASLAQAVTTGVDFTVPIIRASTIISRMLWNGGINVTLGEMNTAMQNYILEAYPALRQPQFDVMNMSINALAGIIIGGIFGRNTNSFDKRMPDMDVPHNSIYETMNVANPLEARKIIAENIKKDSTGKLTKEMSGGRDIHGVWKSMALARIHRPHPTDNQLSPEIINEMNEVGGNMAEQAEWAFTSTQYDPFFINVTKRNADVAAVFDIKRELIVKGNMLPANSYLGGVNINNNVSEGTDLYGTTKQLPFPTELGAKRFLITLEKRIERGQVPIESTLEVIPKGGGYVVAWNWKQLYEPVSLTDTHVQKIGMGIGPIKKDVTDLARSTWFDNISKVGRLNPPMENAGIVNQEIERAIFTNLTKNLNEALLKNKKYNRELDEVINHAEQNAHLRTDGAFYDMKSLSVMFPHLGVPALERLHATHQIWRRAVKIEYLFDNREYRNKLAYQGMEALWRVNEKDGKVDELLGVVTKQLQPNDISSLLAREGKGNTMLWDYDRNLAVEYNKEAFDAENKIIVKLNEDIKIDKTDAGQLVRTYKYGVVKQDGNLKFNYLPEFILDEIDGYSPRAVKENYFVDAFPEKAIMDGKLVTSHAALYKIKTTLGGFRTKADADEFIYRYIKDYPNMILVPREDTGSVSMRKIEDLYRLKKSERLHAKRKREKMLSLKGFARNEDRWVSITDSYRTLAKHAAHGDHGLAIKESFIQNFGDMIPSHYVNEMPDFIEELIPPTPNTKENQIRLQEAQAYFKYNQRFNQIQQAGDFRWNRWWHSVANSAERLIVPENISKMFHKESKGMVDKLYLLSRQGNIPYKWATQFVTMNMISMNILRQYMIQPAEMLVMHSLFPNQWGKTMAQMMSFRLALTATSHDLGPISRLIMYHARRGSGLSDQEFDETMAWFEESGLLSGFDSHAYVSDMSNDAKNMLVEDYTDLGLKYINKVGLFAPRAARKVGYDPAELTQRVGNLTMAKHLWQRKNPTLDWRTPENKAIIAAEGLKLSGSMNKGASYDYQHNWLKPFLQFQAIIQKQTMNQLQDTATIMNDDDRARLALARIILFGDAGLVGGTLAAIIYDLLNDEEGAPFVSDPKWRMALETGIIDPIMNKSYDLAISVYRSKMGLEKDDSTSTVMIGKSISPVAEYGFPHIAGIAEILKLTNGNPSDNPRFPVLHMGASLFKTYHEIKSWTHIKPITTAEQFEFILREALETATIFGNMEKALVMMEARQYLSSKGKSLGLAPSYADIIYKGMFGGENQKQYKMFEVSNYMMELGKNEKEIAKKVYTLLQNVYSKQKNGAELKEDKAAHISKLSSFLTMVAPTIGRQSRENIMDHFMTMDKQSQNNVGQSIVNSILKNQTRSTSELLHKALSGLEDIKHPALPEIKKILELVRDPETEPLYLQEGK